MKMYQIVGFQKLYNKIKETSMPLKTAYKFSKLLSKINDEIVFYQTRLNEILEKYGEKDKNNQFILVEDGKSIKIKNDNIIDCQKEINELELLDIEIDNIKFSLDELATLEIKIEEIEILMPLIEENNE